MSRPVSFLLLALLGPGVPVLAAPAATHPVVPGFERFFSEKADARGGQLLLTELNCVRCHDPGDSAAPASRKQGPVLDGVAGRVRAAWLRKYLADPQAADRKQAEHRVVGRRPRRRGEVQRRAQ